jgi:putative redox protein
MTAKKHTVTLSQIGVAAFEASAAEGGKLVVDGAPEIGGEGRGMRPMELLLASLASCSAMDVLHILRKQKQPLEGLAVEIEGVRADAVPSPFTHIRLVFTATGGVDDHKLQRAAALAVEKYCSAIASLNPALQVSWLARNAQSSAPSEP